MPPNLPQQPQQDREGGARILILEDDPSMSLLERRKLERAGYRVRQAANAEEARKLLAAGEGVDLILLDYQLSGHSSGLEFYRELHGAGLDVPAILVTGFTDEERLAEAMRAGVRDFIPKTEGALDLMVPTVDRVVKQVRAERELAESDARRRMDERFRTSMENMLDPFGLYTAVRDPETGRIIDFQVDFVNRAACLRVGIPSGEQAGRRLLELFPAVETSGIFAAFSRVVETGEPFVVDSFPIDGPAKTADERRVWLDFSVAKLGDGVAAAWRDVTARKEAEIALKRANAEAEEASHAKDRFLAVLSHELRTPLTPVLALVSAMERDPRFDAEVRENASTIRRNIELEARLIDDILDVTRIIRGKLTLKSEEMDLRPLIEHVAKMSCEYQATPKEVTCHTELAPGPHLARVDAARMTQVFWNLLTNAVKFTPPGGSVCVRTHFEEDAETPETGARRVLVVEVHDTGIGIDPRTLGQIFKPFEQGEQGITRRYGGLGLGLTISKAIIERHGGTLSAASDGPGKGATFTIRLPQPKPQPEQAHGHPAQPGSGQTGDARSAAAEDLPDSADGLDHAQPAASGRLLMVEDHDDTGHVLARMLRRAGYEVTVATSVREALAVAEQLARQDGCDGKKTRDPFDLLISDIGLPDGTGHDLMRELRQRYDVPGIALSGFGMEEDFRKSEEAGFARHLTKPADLGMLKTAIREVLAASRADVESGA